MGVFDFLKKKNVSSSFSSSSESSFPSSFGQNDPFKTPPTRPDSLPSLGQNDPFSKTPDFQNNTKIDSFPGNDSMNARSNYSYEDSIARQNNSMSEMENNPGQYEQTYSNDNIMLQKNIEIMLSKLDAIRTAIENLDHRMSNIEKELNTHQGKNNW